jgi:hypothetical protein
MNKEIINQIQSFLEIAYRTKSKGLMLQSFPKQEKINFYYFVHESIAESFYANLASLFDRSSSAISLKAFKQYDTTNFDLFMVKRGETIKKILENRNNILDHRSKEVYSDPSQKEQDMVDRNEIFTSDLLVLIEEATILVENILKQFNEIPLNKVEYEKVRDYFKTSYITEVVNILRKY